MRTFIYPGSFDPFTKGHADIARRAALLCDRLIVAVMTNKSKSPAFSTEDRVWMATECLKNVPGVSVSAFGGLLVNFYKENGATAVVRGLRSESDFRFEAELAAANKLLYPSFEMLLLPCRSDLTFTSSSIVREVATYGGDITNMVPDEIRSFVAEHLRRTVEGEENHA
ncbi:MAG: pantetheine-phosphate adenylyltransferase [Clostridiaceae bacterium]|nr:pantetheine-phosphate adenylyltransferase [Clostridiaceae bacterium]